MSVSYEVTALVTFRVPWRLARTSQGAVDRIENLEEHRIEQGLSDSDIEIVAVQVSRTDRIET